MGVHPSSGVLKNEGEWVGLTWAYEGDKTISKKAI